MSIISTVPKGAAVEGINPNLLRNWYFLNPVNQRGATTGSIGYCIDGWNASYGSGGVTWSLTSNGLSFQPTNSSSYTYINQYIESAVLTELVGKTICVFALTSNGDLFGGRVSYAADITVYNGTYSGHRVQIRFVGNELRFESYTSALTLVAVKFELGDLQTLAHQENGAWVLNEIPDYEEEYYRCITSDADSNDTYANQKVSNITVQCNSVGSSSLRYYNKLIQSTHKVLDSTFSNPAAQTSDITVTTYDGYLDFSNGFASGATTNITLVLGTSGPVLSTSTTAPS